MGVLAVIFLGCAALLAASSSVAVDDKKEQQGVPERVEDINVNTPTNTGKGEDALDGLTKKQGCEGRQRFIFGLATGIFGVVASIVGFTVDRIESAQTTAQLNEIQDQIRELDRKVDELTQMVSDLQLGQEYLQQVILYARDELRLRNMLDTHAKMQISNGQYELPGYNIQDWADSVLSYRSDGVDQVLYNILNMVKPHSGVFGGKSLMEIYHLRLIDRDNLEKYTEKMQQKAAQIYGLIGGGYSVWITALRIKGRTSGIPAKAGEMKNELSTVGTSLLKYTTRCRGLGL
uniref:Uncharacterized protein n=1 Tax=Branchiostoma floridae TaxID=7739 RepID=C3ZNG3_BRAFL|eukprot:XP_002589905.1 hypothetical protein BRAFLDRAFT_81967 [Branchiostoma floridae]